MEDRYRLSPTMVSRKLIALAFIRDYIERTGGSPSLGEIAAAIGTDDRKLAQKAVRALAGDGHIIRQPGPRGITLPGRVADAVRELRKAGYVVDEHILHLDRPGGSSVTTLWHLPLVPPFEDVPLEE